MKTKVTTAFVVLVLLTQVHLLHGQDSAKPSDQVRLQQALFAEEAERDLPKAAKEYQKLVEEYTAARRIGLSALYRLAEVRRKQNRSEEAAPLYLRVVAEFPDSPEARLSRENLTVLGVALPKVPAQIPDDPDETKELRRLMMLAKNSPEQMWEEVPLALNDSGDQTTSPLSKAARRGWLRVVAFLLQEHKKVGREQRELDLALYSSAQAGQVESCRLLFKNGATLEIAKHALVEAIIDNHQAVGDWLLSQGVDVNTPNQGRVKNLENRRFTQFDVYRGENRLVLEYSPSFLTPLGAAIAADDPEWIERLLRLGADVNHQGAKNRPVNLSPLSLACWKGHAPLVKRLLDLGANPNQPDRGYILVEKIRQPASTGEGWLPLHYAAGKPEIVSLLLAAGADARLTDADGFSPLHAAAFLNSAESCRVLLKAGATQDPAAILPWLGEKSWTPLMLASAHARAEDEGKAAKEIIQFLLDQGANPKPEILAPHDLLDLCPVSQLRVWLAEKLRYPELVRSKEITLTLPTASARLSLAAPRNDESPPSSLTEVLLAWVEPLTITVLGDRSFDLDQGRVRRARKDGTFETIPFQVGDPKTHPDLQWGDLIEFLPKEMDVPALVTYYASQRRHNTVRATWVSLTLDSYLKLFSQLEKKITIAWPDRPRQELTLRGGLRVYDPSRPEAPLLPPRALHQLLGGEAAQTLQLQRSEKNGGHLIDIPKEEEHLTAGVAFQDGDVLKVASLAPEKEKKIRQNTIQLLEPKSGFRWRQFVPFNGTQRESNGNFKEPAIHPTLLQFLTAFYLPVETSELEAMSEALKNEDDFKKWEPGEIARAVSHSGVAPWATIRHPDLREIWIERLDGTRIKFPLAELVAKVDGDTADEFFRKADLELQAGDIVEIRILPDHEGQPWKGFEPKFARFIQRALTYDFRRGEDLKNGFRHHVKWTPPRWFETSVGPIAVSQSEDQPFVMDVNEVGRAIVRGPYRWGLPERWLRQDILIKESRGRYNMVSKNRMGGTDEHPHWKRHRGLDGRGLLKRLKPRKSSSSSNSIRRTRYVPRPK